MNQFNEQLMKALCDTEEEDDDLCLISNETLEDDHIKLDCGHKFNYQSILKEITQQKKGNKLEITKLKKNQMKCPYCRYIQNGLLPHRESYAKILYVNWPSELSLLPNNCVYTFKSGKRKGEKCNKKCLDEKCKMHIKYNTVVHRCTALLVSGKRKGQCCNAKIKSTPPIKLCGRHLKNNHIII